MLILSERKLVPFGEAMKAYSEAIMGMDSAAITNSATAGKALVELANTIPNTGGLVSWFTGDNDLGGFGDSLVQFGSGIKSVIRILFLNRYRNHKSLIALLMEMVELISVQ